MATTAPLPPPRYHAAASHYLAGRPRYSPRLIQRVAALTGLPRTGRVLDLGCGPAQLGLAFAPLAAEVLPLDPFAVGGMITEVVETYALIGSRGEMA